MDGEQSVPKCELHHPNKLPSLNKLLLADKSPANKICTPHLNTQSASDDLLLLLSATKNEQTGTAPSSTDPYVEFSLMNGFFTDDVADMKDGSILDKYFTSSKIPPDYIDLTDTDVQLISKSDQGISENLNTKDKLNGNVESESTQNYPTINKRTSRITDMHVDADNEPGGLKEMDGKPLTALSSVGGFENNFAMQTFKPEYDDSTQGIEAYDTSKGLGKCEMFDGQTSATTKPNIETQAKSPEQLSQPDILDKSYYEILQNINNNCIEQYCHNTNNCERQYVKCPKCKIKLLLVNLKTHFFLHKPTAYQCTVCNSTPYFKTEEKLIDHMEVHIQNTLKGAVNRMNTLEKLLEFARHFPKYWSKIPSHSKISDEYDNNNIATADHNKKFNCPLCGIVLVESRAAFHMKHKHPPELKFACEICEKKCATAVYLENHMRLVHSEAKFKCQYCSKAYRRTRLLDNHVAMKHPENFKVVKRHQCNQCEKSFLLPRQLQAHKTAHAARLFCDQCGKSFRSGNNLNQHLKSLSHLKVIESDGNEREVRNFLCEACGVGFASKQHLRQHFTSLKHKQKIGKEDEYKIPEWRLKAKASAKKNASGTQKRRPKRQKMCDVEPSQLKLNESTTGPTQRINHDEQKSGDDEIDLI